MESVTNSRIVLGIRFYRPKFRVTPERFSKFADYKTIAKLKAREAFARIDVFSHYIVGKDNFKGKFYVNLAIY